MPGEPCAKIDGITCIRWAARGWWQHMQQGVGHEQGPAAMAVSLARAVDTTVHLPMPGLSPWPCRNRQTMVTTLGADLAAFQPAPPAAEPVMPAVIHSAHSPAASCSRAAHFGLGSPGRPPPRRMFGVGGVCPAIGGP